MYTQQSFNYLQDWMHWRTIHINSPWTITTLDSASAQRKWLATWSLWRGWMCRTRCGCDWCHTCSVSLRNVNWATNRWLERVASHHRQLPAPHLLQSTLRHRAIRGLSRPLPAIRQRPTLTTDIISTIIRPVRVSRLEHLVLVACSTSLPIIITWIWAIHLVTIHRLMLPVFIIIRTPECLIITVEELWPHCNLFSRDILIIQHQRLILMLTIILSHHLPHKMAATPLRAIKSDRTDPGVLNWPINCPGKHQTKKLFQHCK